MARKKKEDEMPEDEKETTNEAHSETECVAVESDPVAETIEVPLTAEAAETPAEDEDAPESPEDT